MNKKLVSLLALASLAAFSFGCSNGDETDPIKPGDKPGDVTPGDNPGDNPSDNPGDKPGDNPGDKPGSTLKPGDVNVVKSALTREKPALEDAAIRDFVLSQYDLNFDLLRKAEESIKGQNAMISTFSIQSALGMTALATDGDTAKQMNEVLHLGDNGHKALNQIENSIISKNKDAIKNDHYSVDAIEVSNSNDIYVSPDYTWQKSWLDALAVNYGAGVTEMNFEADPEKARTYINKVVSDDTHERIPELLPENAITKATKLVLTNAVYFKAPWRDELNKAANKLAFNKMDKSKKDVDYIVGSGHYAYSKGVDYQAVSVPLREGSFEVLFILPDEDKFESVQSTLNGEMMKTILNDTKMIENPVDISIPCIQFDTSLSLKDPLKALGMTDAFDPDKADFSKATEEKDNALYISEVYHKSFVAMNEDGVEAAAATAVVVDKNTAIPAEPIRVSLDRPYFFTILDRDTKSPIFVGRVLEP